MEASGTKQKVLITGGSGFLGRYLLKTAPDHYQVIAQYRSKPPNEYGRDVRFLYFDFFDDDWRALEGIRPDIIIHTAAMASIDECEVKPEIAYHFNFEVTRRLVDYAAEQNIKFIFISSDVVFDGQKGNYSETDDPNPLNVYAHSKVIAENYILENYPAAVVVRPSLFYGSALNGRPSFTETMLRSLHAGKQVFVFIDQFRTPILVNNLSHALWELAETDFRGILHLGGGSPKISRLEMGELLCEMFKLDQNLLVPMKSEQANLVANRPLDCSLDTSLSRSLLKTRFCDCRNGFSLAYR